MKAKSRFYLAADGVNLGDHLITVTDEKECHGIYAGRCRVISVKGGIVVAEELQEFACGSNIQVYLQKTDFAAAEIVRRAESQIGTVITPMNDRYFCEWCFYGLQEVPKE